MEQICFYSIPEMIWDAVFVIAAAVFLVWVWKKTED